MGGFILGAVVALLVGMRLARLIDGNKSAREACGRPRPPTWPITWPNPSGRRAVRGSGLPGPRPDGKLLSRDP
ncbi:hypothetical protein [Actinoplanes couchii]|uniref:Uncharacterized protein n=1 Tax=Actinoplanes couchii TaxID=403638 RepID=A0ABQ3XH46_9ACTN|nr:hypothetical protein [Actinoplanes couchii]MDR6320693.1 hypothetical protein [Actinoplanes couchii]GID57821.1 hypothetical protein Aco03nite_062250 [Actinoplanes couchii]